MEYPVFILDNDKDFLKLLTEVLKEHFIVVGTTDTNEFIKSIKQPAVILIDWYLDFGIVGLDAMRMVRKENPLTHPIYISNMASKEVLLDVVNQGWGCYFIEKDKSDFLAQLIEKIKTAKALLRLKMEAASKDAQRLLDLEQNIDKTLKAFDGT